MSSALLLLLLDSRSPAGGHNHSAGMEPAIAAGWVRDLGDVEAFCRGRLATSGRVAAAFAAAACAGGDLAELDAEYDARTASEAVRAASRQLGNGLRRLLRAMLPALDVPAGLHHPLVLGAGVAAAGGTPLQAARAAALTSVSAPASAAVRLLGLDPFAVQAMLTALAREIDATGYEVGLAADLPTDSAPAIDLLADVHLTSEVRLFAS